MMTSSDNPDVAVKLDGDKEPPSVNCSVSTTAEPKGQATDSSKALLTDQNMSSNAASSANKDDGESYKPLPLKKKHRRGSRRSKGRKYKPYLKLTWEEKKAVEERDSRRAVSIREKYMHEKGRPLAPFNTSQFLMAEHDTQEPDLHVHASHSKTTRFPSSADDSDDADSSFSDEERDIEGVRNFLQKDFAEAYDRFHSEALRRMNKDQLINEYMQLEEKVESLERELTSIKSNGKQNGYTPPNVLNDVNNSDIDMVEDPSRRTLELEIEKLREENRKLHEENSILRPSVDSKECPTS